MIYNIDLNIINFLEQESIKFINVNFIFFKYYLPQKIKEFFS